MLSKSASEFINFTRFFMIVGLAYHHAFSIPGNSNFPRSSMLIYDALLPAAVNSFIHMAFMAAVPLLSIISGYLFILKLPSLMPPKLLGYYYKKSKALVLPMIIWGLVCISFGYLNYILLDNAIFLERVRYNFANFGWGDLPSAIFGGKQIPYAYQFWFIHDLILTILIAPFIKLFFKWRLVAGLTIIVVLYLWFDGFIPPFMFSGNVITFFILGMYCGFLGVDFSGTWIKKYRYTIAMLALIFLAMLTLRSCLYLFFNPGDEIAKVVRSEDFLKIMRLFGAACFFGLLQLWRLKATSSYKFLNTYSSYSFFVFALHFPLISVVEYLNIKLWDVGSSFTQTVMVFTTPAITVVICILIAKIIEAKTPKIYGVLAGGR